MTDAWLMEADCIHGIVWYECAECAKDDPRPPDEPPGDYWTTPYQRARRAYIAACIAFAVSAVAVVLALIAVVNQ